VDASKQALAEVRPRWHWTLEEKRRITQETFLGGSSVARVAQRYALNANQLFKWQSQYREGRLGSRAATKLLPVTITDDQQLASEKVAEFASTAPPGPSRLSCPRESAHHGSSGRDGFTDGDGVFAAMISLPADQQKSHGHLHFR
jgi:transposase-like protein